MEAKSHSIPVNRPHTRLVVRRRHGDDRKMGFSMRVVVGACFFFVGVVRSDEAPRVVTDTEEGSLAWLEDEAVDATLLDLEGAARAGDPRAHHKLGEASLHGAGSRPQDFRAAAGHFIASGSCVEIKSSTRLQCARMRMFQRNFFGFASRARREQSIRPKISRIDFDLIEIESSEVW